MQAYMQKFMEKMDQEGIKYVEVDENTVKICFNGDNIKSVNTLAVFDEDGQNLVQFRCWEIESFKNKESEAMILCNELNYHFRWVKFFVDKDMDIVALLDAMLDDDSAGDECLSLLMRFVSIVDSAYPQIAKIRWA